VSLLKVVCTVCLNLCEFIKTFVPFPGLSTLKKITLIQFRNYSSGNYEFTAPVTCITGPNGSGKTNLLDAVYYLCYTKSYFSAYQQNSVQQGQDGFRVEGSFDQNLISCKWKQGKKEIAANNVPYERLTDHIGKYAAVMIAPDDMELINDGSELRRRWVDSILSQTDRQYLERLMRYQKILQQRNAWLKMQAVNPTDSSQLEYYDNLLSADGTYIQQQRLVFLRDFMPLLDEYYHRLSGGKETITTSYQTDLEQKTMKELLAAGLQADLRMQRTLKGIHKDDWTFMLDGMPLKQFGSQGQKKSYLFALKLAQYAYLSRILGFKPILLLDDIFEKLDQNRILALMRIIRGQNFGQVILTDTHADRVREAFLDITDIQFIEL